MSRIIESIPVELVDTGARPDYITPTKIVEELRINKEDFYVFDKKQILEIASLKYRKFLKDGGYADLDNCKELHISKSILKWDDYLLSKIDNNNPSDPIFAGIIKLDPKCYLRTQTKAGDYVTALNRKQSKAMLNFLGGKLLTTRLMYGLFIPYLIYHVDKGDFEAEITLNEMRNNKTELLEDLIKNENKLLIGNGNELDVSFPNNKGLKFNLWDLDELGYPRELRKEGEFPFHWPRIIGKNIINSVKRGNEISNYGTKMGLNCSWRPTNADDLTGIRLARFIY